MSLFTFKHYYFLYIPCSHQTLFWVFKRTVHFEGLVETTVVLSDVLKRQISLYIYIIFDKCQKLLIYSFIRKAFITLFFHLFLKKVMLLKFEIIRTYLRQYIMNGMKFPQKKKISDCKNYLVNHFQQLVFTKQFTSLYLMVKLTVCYVSSYVKICGINIFINCVNKVIRLY